MCVCVCVCVCTRKRERDRERRGEREEECVFVCVCVINQDSASVCVCERVRVAFSKHVLALKVRAFLLACMRASVRARVHACSTWLTCRGQHNWSTLAACLHVRVAACCAGARALLVGSV